MRLATHTRLCFRKAGYFLRQIVTRYERVFQRIFGVVIVMKLLRFCVFLFCLSDSFYTISQRPLTVNTKNDIFLMNF